MVKAGDPTDAVIDQLHDAMEEGDIIIDGGDASTPTPSAARRPCASAGCTSSAPGSSGGEEGFSNASDDHAGWARPDIQIAGPPARGTSAHRQRRAVLHPHRPDGAGTSSRWSTRPASNTPTCSSSARPTICCATSGVRVRADRRRALRRVEQERSGRLPGRDHRQGAAPEHAKTGKPLVDVILDEAERRARVAGR